MMYCKQKYYKISYQVKHEVGKVSNEFMRTMTVDDLQSAKNFVKDIKELGYAYLNCEVVEVKSFNGDDFLELREED